MIDQRERLNFGDGGDAREALVADYQRVLDGMAGLATLIDLLVRERERLADVVDVIKGVMLEGAVGTDATLVEQFAPSGPAGPTAQEIATVAFTSLVGVQLTRQFFGALPFDMAAERYADVLATLVLGRTGAEEL